MEIIYKAEDGTEFTTKKECERYEREVELKKSKYKAFDINGVYMEDNIDEAYFIDVDTEEACIFLYNEYGINLDCIGKWVYNPLDEEWEELEYFKNKYKEIFKLLKILEKVG